MPLRNEKCFWTVVFAIIATCILTAIIGFYIGFVLKDIVLLASGLVVIELSVALFSEFTGLFKDQLNIKEQELAKSLDINKLKKIAN